MPDGTKDLYAAMNIVSKLLDHETPILNRKLPTPKRGGEGNKTRLSQNVWFQCVFYQNELNSALRLTDKVLTDQQIMMNWELEYANERSTTKVNVGGGLKSGIHSIGTYRSRYRKATLYSQMLKPFLMSFRYDRYGYPVMDRKKKFHYLNLEAIRKLCLELKIADPRFFTNEELGTIKETAKRRNELNLWGIPSPHQYMELDKSIVGGIYGSYKLYEKLVPKSKQDKPKRS